MGNRGLGENATTASAKVEEVARRTHLSPDIVRVFARLDDHALGTALAAVAGCGLALATGVIVLRGGPNQGWHLWLLVNYLPGYSVSAIGVAVGFAYGAAIGYVCGYALATLRNAVVSAYLHHLWRKAERRSLRDLLDRIG